MNTLKTIRVIVCSPSDVNAERDIVNAVADEFNHLTANHQGFHVQVWRWETDSHPGFHPLGPQGKIDELMRIEDSELVVGIFWTRFGTPTHDANSGTEHELRKALEVWSRNHRPQCLVYFKQAAYAAQTPEETDQWSAVLRFRRDFPKKGLWWSFESTQDFEAAFRQHLHIWFKEFQQLVQVEDDHEATPPVLDLPQFSDGMRRATLLTRLKGLSCEAPVLVLGGISGSGKTYLASEYVNDLRISAPDRKVFWHDTQPGESVEDLLHEIQKPMGVNADSVFHKCRDLVAELSRQRALLVLDNFQAGNQESYAMLIAQAQAQPPPAFVLITTQRKVPVLQVAGALRHLHLRGFSDEETKSYLQQRGVTALPERQLRNLIKATEALPMALCLFCTLVTQFEEDPETILGDGIQHQESLSDWFKRVNQHLNPAAAELLRGLSVLEMPFNIGMAKVVAKASAVVEVSDAIRLLNAAYLLQRPSSYRWKVHDLVASLVRELLPPDLSSQAHHAFAMHFMRGYRRNAPSAILGDEEFIWKSRALDHLLKSGRHTSVAESLFLDLAATAKARGLYRRLVLTTSVLKNQGSTNPWLDYHLAQAYLALDVPQRCAAIAFDTASRATAKEPNLQLALARLRAEAAMAFGEFNEAREILSLALSSEYAQSARGATLEQAQSIIVLIDIKQRHFDLAIEGGQRLLARAAKANSERGCAVACARIGAAHLESGNPNAAVSYLKQAIGHFEASRDRRGAAWAGMLLAETHERSGDAKEAYAVFVRVAATYEDIGECGKDYRDYIERASTSADSKIRELAKKERDRISDLMFWVKQFSEVDEVDAQEWRR